MYMYANLLTYIRLVIHIASVCSFTCSIIGVPREVTQYRGDGLSLRISFFRIDSVAFLQFYHLSAFYIRIVVHMFMFHLSHVASTSSIGSNTVAGATVVTSHFRFFGTDYVPFFRFVSPSFGFKGFLPIQRVSPLFVLRSYKTFFFEHPSTPAGPSIRPPWRAWKTCALHIHGHIIPCDPSQHPRSMYGWLYQPRDVHFIVLTILNATPSGSSHHQPFNVTNSYSESADIFFHFPIGPRRPLGAGGPVPSP